MKKALFLFALLFIFSCSDKLNKNDVQTIIKDCGNDFREAKSNFVFGNNINSMSKGSYHLASLGMIQIDSIKQERSFLDNKDRYNYNVSFTAKGREHIISVSANDKTKNPEDSLALVKSAEVHLLSIDEVHEIPGENRAEVRVTYIAKNKTPFAILLPKNERNLDTIKIPKPMIFRKTNSGWKFCDN